MKDARDFLIANKDNVLEMVEEIITSEYLEGFLNDKKIPLMELKIDLLATPEGPQIDFTGGTTKIGEFFFEKIFDDENVSGIKETFSCWHKKIFEKIDKNRNSDSSHKE